MKTFLILFSLILPISYSQHSSPKTEDSSKPVIEISPVPNPTVESNRFPTNQIVELNRVKIPAFSNPKKESMEDFLTKESRSILKEFGLYDLEKRPIEKDDIEIRVWQFSDLYMRIYKNLAVKESVFILKRTNGNWSAKVFRNTVNQKSGTEKLIKTKLDAPQSGWGNVWQHLVNNELLTFPDSVSGELAYVSDAGIFITESKIDGIFKTYRYAENGEIREIKHTAKILSIIADEFDLEDFQATKKYEE